MPTQIVSQIIVTDKNQEDIEFFVSGNKEFITIRNASDDATAFSIAINIEDWKKVKEFIDSKLK